MIDPSILKTHASSLRAASDKLGNSLDDGDVGEAQPALREIVFIAGQIEGLAMVLPETVTLNTPSAE